MERGFPKMNYCNVCLTTDLRPNAKFEGGTCIACLYGHKHNKISDKLFLQRLKSLRGYITEHNRRTKYLKSRYDCIVGVSGGKDSTRQAHWVRDRLGLRPLLISAAYPPKQMTQIGAKNLENLIRMGFDIETVCPAPVSAAKLSLRGFEIYGNVNKSTEMALFATVPKIAIEKKIKFIFWGENPALQVGDAATLGENIFDGNNLRHLNTLTEGGYQWIEDQITPYKTDFYKYPEVKEFNKAAVKIIYLGPAWNDWSNDENSEYAALHGLSLRPYDSKETGDISGASMLDEEFTNINMMLKYYKFGFGRATDTCCELIRQKKISRSDAILVVKRFDGVCSDKIIRKYCDYTNITSEYFWKVTNRFVNERLFEKSSKRPFPKFSVGKGLV